MNTERANPKHLQSLMKLMERHGISELETADIRIVRAVKPTSPPPTPAPPPKQAESPARTAVRSLVEAIDQDPAFEAFDKMGVVSARV